MTRSRVILGLIGALLLAAPTSKATNILVGQCIEFAPCWTGPGPTPWSDSLSLADLTSLGLGSTVDFTAGQTSEFVIRLGVTTVTFDTSGGPVVETLPEFSGGFHNDPCNFCEVDLVGTFSIPADALDATISGTFGNSLNPTSAGVNVCLGSGGPPCAATTIPEPASLTLFGSGLLGFVSLVRRRKS